LPEAARAYPEVDLQNQTDCQEGEDCRRWLIKAEIIDPQEFGASNSTRRDEVRERYGECSDLYAILSALTRIAFVF
jgi:hypothetical protein